MGAIDLIGWVTKVTEYSSAMTIPAKISVIITTTKAHTLTSKASADIGCFVSLLWLINLLLQNRGHQILRALLREQALGLLAVGLVEVVRVLALVAVGVLTPSQSHQRQDQCSVFYVHDPRPFS
jgi:hypothetical protein